jgi:hypothetical protein
MVILTLRTLQFSRFAMLSVLAVASAFVRKLLVFNERGFHLLLRVVVHDIVKKLDERLNRKLDQLFRCECEGKACQNANANRQGFWQVASGSTMSPAKRPRTACSALTMLRSVRAPNKL